MKLIGKFFILVEGLTFLIITFLHLIKLFFYNFTDVLASYIQTLGKNHLESIIGTYNIIILWINSFSTKHLPLKETLKYFWEYKITWVGLIIIMFFIFNSITENIEA